MATLCRLGGRFVPRRQSDGGLVLGGVVRHAVAPATVDDPDPGPGQDPNRVGVIGPSGSRLGIDAGRPIATVSGVVGEGVHGSAEAFVAGPSEVHRLVLAGALGDGAHARQGGNGILSVVSWAAIAPLGEHLACVVQTCPWKGSEALSVRM